LSHKPRLIKVVNKPVVKLQRLMKLQTKPQKTGKVTAVVADMSIFKKKDVNCRVLVLEIRGLLAKRQKEPIFCRKIPANQEAFLKNQEKAKYQRN
jgi:hypothetical protein